MNEFGKSDSKTTEFAPFSVRVSDDVKARLKQLQEESGSTQPDFYRSLVALYIQHKGLREIKTQEEEDIENALAVISHSTLSLINRFDDNKKAQKIANERYAADLDDLNRTVEDLNKCNTSLSEEIQSVTAQNEELKKQLESMKHDTRVKIEKINSEVAKEVEMVKTTMNKKLSNLQAVADTINEIKEQAKLAKETLHKAEEERDKHINIATKEKAKIISLETTITEMQLRLKTSHNDIDRLQSEIEKIKETSSSLSSQLSCEIIAKNRAEAKLEILEPQINVLNQENASLRSNYIELERSKNGSITK